MTGVNKLDKKKRQQKIKVYAREKRIKRRLALDTCNSESSKEVREEEMESQSRF